MSSQPAPDSADPELGSESTSADAREIRDDWQAIRVTLDQIGRKWTPSVIKELLRDGPHRFAELKERLGGITSATLSNSLEDLQEKGLVDRTVLDTKPVRVEYELTERGQSLEPVLESMVGWGKENVCTKKFLQNKYHPEIICRLLTEGSHYFSDLKRAIDLSNKTLSDSLGRLQEVGIVDRIIEDEKPVRIKYSLTERGESLTPVFESLSVWGREQGTLE